MKHAKYYISTVLVTLLLTGCGGNFVDSQSLNDKHLVSLTIENTKTTGYYTGDDFSNLVTFDTFAHSTDGTKKQVTPNLKQVINFASVDGYPLADNGTPLTAGTYVASIFAKYTDENNESASYTDNVTVDVQSVFENLNETCLGLSAKINNVIVPEKKIAQQLDLTLTFNWQLHGKESLVLDSAHPRSGVTYKLHLDGDNTDLTNENIEEHLNYVLEVKYKDYVANLPFHAELGIKKIDKKDLTVLPKDFNDAYSPLNGEVHNALVIPLTFHADDEIEYASNLREWNATSLQQLRDAYDENFVRYYQSLGVNFNITVTDPYDITNPAWHVEKLLEQDKPYTLLYAVIASVFPQERAKHDATYWHQFDIDGDGQIDDVHFVGNFVHNKWGTSLWPHQSQTFNPNANPDLIVVNSYTYNHFDNAISTTDMTSVHEQGHAFGLLDYYDYTEENGHLIDINYVGNIDMQSSNTYDWNSYSKLSCGLVSPYVVTGYESDCEVTIQAAAVNGDCIIVPADYQTWNGSAYDEYFLIELFAKKGINEEFWDSLIGEDYGIRIYHVDARLYNQLTGSEPDVNDKENWPNLGIGIGANNSYDYTALGVGSVAEWKDFKQLCLIQKGKVDTFGKKGGIFRRRLNSSDLFYAGDVFTFNDYRHFLSKTEQNVTSMDNGEKFPWTIEIVSASIDEATIRFTK